MSSNRNIYSDI